MLRQAKTEYELNRDLSLNKSIYLQFSDIKQQIVKKEKVVTREVADSKYSIGVLAIRNFNDEDDYQKKTKQY